jgi:hypothetical protein
MSPLGKGPIWLAILAETFWLVQVSEINMHHTSSSDTLSLMQWLAAFCQFVHECRECQHVIAAHWQLCPHCDI